MCVGRRLVRQGQYSQTFILPLPQLAFYIFSVEFLHQPTAVLFGAEMMAHQHDMAVVYYEMRKKSRGNYEIELKLITDTPSSCSYGEITEKHTRLLEETIRREPAYWIWSHKRWKRTLPEDFEALRKEQQEQFEARFALKS